MSNYVKTVDFAAKDALTTGNPSKLARGTEVDTEFNNIATAIATKEDTANKGSANGYASLDSSGDVPSAQLPAASATVVGAVELATDAETITGTDTTRAITPANLAAENTAARILTKLLTVDGSGSSLDADTVDGIQGASLVQTSRTVSVSGTGLSGGGDLSANRTITIDQTAMTTRNITGKSGVTKTLSTSAASGGSDGDIWYRY